MPFGRHVVGSFQNVHLVKDLIFGVFMRAQEVIISYPESQVIVGTVDVVETIRVTVGSFVGTVQSFDHLLEWTVFRRNSIDVGKSNHLSDSKGKIFAEFFDKLHCSKRISTEAICNEFKVFWELGKSAKGHSHCQDTRTDATVIGYLIAKNRACGSVHDQPNVGFDPTNLDISFIRNKDVVLLVRILVYKGLDAYSSGLAVVGDLLVRDTDVVEVL